MYIKKDEFKGIKLVLSDEIGTYHIIETDVIENDSVYLNNKFDFDVIEDKKEIEEIIEQQKEIVIEETEQEEKKSVKEQIIEIEELNKQDEKTEVLELIDQCSTVEQLHELAEEYNVNIDKRKRNIKKIKDEFKSELVI